MKTPAERSERDAHNSRELRRIRRTAVGYGVPAVGFCVAAYITDGVLQIVLLVVAVILAALAAWITLFALGGTLLVRAARRTR